MRNKIAIIIIVTILMLFFSLRSIGKKTSPVIMRYGEAEATKLANMIINKSVGMSDLEKLRIDSLFIVNRNNDGVIETIDFDSVVVNRIILNITTKIQNNIKLVENGQINKLNFSDEILNNYNIKGEGIFYEIPLGVALNNPMFSNLGPKIPIKFSLIGNIVANLENNIKSYGINNALIEVKMKISLSEKIIFPFADKNITINNEVPIAIKIIEGPIPTYYYNNKSNSSPLTIPVE